MQDTDGMLRLVALVLLLSATCTVNMVEAAQSCLTHDQVRVQVAYFPWGNPQPVSCDEVQNIVSRALGDIEGEPTPWLLVVGGSIFDDPDSGHLFLVPEVSTERLRQGRCVYLELSGDTESEVYHYSQVSLPNRPFRTALKTPSLRLLPFATPQHLTRDELIGLADHVRSEDKAFRRQPIQFATEDDIVTVYAGVGYGPTRRYRISDDGFELIGSGWWAN